MRELVEPHSQRATLPPGSRFYPSEDLLLRYYLTNKNTPNNDTGNRHHDFYGSDLIRELDLYGYDPLDLPETACFSYGYGGRKSHWYCYTVRVLKERRRRKVRSGFWVKNGKVRDIFGNGGDDAVLGTRTRFVFYVGNSMRNATRTDWMLYEYALVNHLLATFVLCRVFKKPCRKNGLSEIGFSCAEESKSAVRHIDIQHDGNVRSDAVEAKVCDDSSIGRMNKISVHPLRCASGQDDHQLMTPPVSVATFQHRVGPEGNQPERLSGLPSGNAMFIEAVTSQQLLLSILEEDFIELNDLV
ncbi:unnamed protein product [Lupinus luteus]|uniref:NAC domain-containing protein n=1 Tax=Lupinus luteus TaxID=3873 RepID=A0AAV1XL23_LUPLU